MSRDLETLWADILSKDPVKIIKAMGSLSDEELGAVIEHLQRMANETGWSEGQRHSASTALELLKE